MEQRMVGKARLGYYAWYRWTIANNLAINGAVLLRVPACGNTTGGPKKPLVYPLRLFITKAGPTAMPLSFAVDGGSGRNGVCLG